MRALRKIFDVTNLLGQQIIRYPVMAYIQRRSGLEAVFNASSLTVCMYISARSYRVVRYEPVLLTFAESPGYANFNLPSNRTNNVGYIIMRNGSEFTVSVNGSVIAEYPDE